MSATLALCTKNFCFFHCTEDPCIAEQIMIGKLSKWDTLCDSSRLKSFCSASDRLPVEARVLQEQCKASSCILKHTRPRGPDSRRT